MTRNTIKALLKVAAEEIAFLDKGWGEDKPPTVAMEYDQLQVAMKELHEEMNALNQKEYGHLREASYEG